MRKSFFTVDFQNKETKTESSRPGLRPGVSVCQKGCEAPRTSTPRSGSAVRSPRRKAGRAAKKGAKHRGQARRAAAAQSEACDAKRGGPPKRVRSTEGKHAAQRQRSPKPATRSGAGRQKGCEARNPQGNGLSEGFLHSLSLKNKLRIDNGTLWI